jgi:hypothetical protein
MPVRSMIFADRDDLPDGMVLEAFEGKLRVRDALGQSRGKCERRGSRWLWSVPDATGIAPDVGMAWRALIEALTTA